MENNIRQYQGLNKIALYLKKNSETSNLTALYFFSKFLIQII